MSLAKINTLPYLLYRHHDANFFWEDEEKNIGMLNGSKVELAPLSFWYIILTKMIPVWLFIIWGSNYFFTTRQLFYFSGEGLIYGFVIAFFIAYAIYLVAINKSQRVIITMVSLAIYMALSMYGLNKDYVLQFQYGFATGIFGIGLYYGVADILAVQGNYKKIYYIRNKSTKFKFFTKWKNNTKAHLTYQLEGSFITLFSDQIYHKVYQNANA